MKILDTLKVYHEKGERTIEICQGDLAKLTPEEAVDVLVVSAFPESYHPSYGSLIGALHQQGVSVNELAQNKAFNWLTTFSCWVSREIVSKNPHIQFRRILCFEAPGSSKAPELVGGIFQCLVALLGEDSSIRSVAMPLVATGSLGTPIEQILAPMLEAAVQWLRHGLPLEKIKIVAYSKSHAQQILEALPALKEKLAKLPPEKEEKKKEGSFQYDVFISYSHQDSDKVFFLIDQLKKLRPNLRVFLDRKELNVGSAWQESIYQALDSCRKIVAVYSPNYLTSKACKEEFNIGLYRDRDSDEYILFPLYLYTADLPTYMKVLQYIDCREGDQTLVEQACQQLISHFETDSPKKTAPETATSTTDQQDSPSKRISPLAGKQGDNPLDKRVKELSDKLDSTVNRIAGLEEKLDILLGKVDELLERPG